MTLSVIVIMSIIMSLSNIKIVMMLMRMVLAQFNYFVVGALITSASTLPSALSRAHCCAS